MAADVNEIQDEVTGIETAMGAKPHIYTDDANKKYTYKDVATRLDAMQRYDDEVAGTVNRLVDASSTGWNLPIGTVRASGTSIAPTVNQLDVDTTKDWHPVLWNRRITDSASIFPWTSSSTITCPKTGWWIVTMRVLATIAKGPNSLDHMCYGRMYLSDHDTDVAVSSSTQPRGTHGWHRLDITYAGEWFHGERLQLQLRHMDSMRVSNRAKYANPVGTMTAYGWCGLTYMRALPSAMTSRPIEDIDPALPA
ncbi:hypothetical protein [Streptomyces sp. BH105]|uniref:hypothetical protein n=1 Tax=Streptomyces sp. BH105 TaxID=3410408 RepID=UPI003CF8F56D